MATELALKLILYSTIEDNDISGGTKIANAEFWMPVENITINHERQPIVAVLPGSEPILIDLGPWKVNIPLEGHANKEKTGQLIQSTIPIANRKNIEEMGATTSGPDWSDNHIILEDHSDSPIRYYRVKIQNVNFSTQSGVSWIAFKITLVGYLIDG